MFRSKTAVATLALASAAGEAHAAPPLHTPWPCDVAYSITQGHNTGSHTDEGAWAWDVGIPQGGLVSAPADGVVRLVRMDSTVGGCSSSYANDANYVVVDFGDGTEALFLHLAAGSSSLSEGDPVQQGDVVGAVGLTGWVCGAHLHFQIQQTCGSWWCPSIPSSFVDFGDPGLGASLISNNCPLREPCAAVADGGELIIDELSTCFERETSYWWNVAEGYEGHHFYTKATDAAAPETIGRWRFDVSVAGRYLVEVFVPDTEANSVAAVYRVEGGRGPSSFEAIDQGANKGWIALGEVDLIEGVGRFVELGDNTGEAVALDRRLAYDAVRLTFLPDNPGVGGGGAGGAGAGAGSGAGGEPGEEGGHGGSAATAEEDADGAGCDCAQASGSAGGPGTAVWLLLGALSRLGRLPSRRRPAPSTRR